MKASVAKITTVRMKVAKSAFTFSTPTLANIAVRAAKIADRIAHNCQVEVKVHPVTANLVANKTARTITAGEASLTLPEIILASA